jgi:HK97 gp10 family phage protein
MSLQIEISRDKLTGLSSALRSALAVVVEETAAEIEAGAKERVPVDTGYLRGSISHEAKGLSGSVSVGADYGFWVEVGTEHRSPRPYLTPAVEGEKESFQQRIKKRLGEVTR